MTLKAEDFLDTLTEDERAAIKEGEADDAANSGDAGAGDGTVAASDAEKAAAAAGAEKTAAEKAAADKAADDKTAADTKPKTDTDAATAAEAGKAAGEGDGTTKPDAAAADTTVVKNAADTEAKPTGARQAIPDWQAPADAKAKLDAIGAARDALAEKFDAGDLSAKDLLAQTNELNRQERTIERAVERAEIATEMTQAVWLKSTVPAFLTAHAHYNTNPTLHTMLDAEVRRLQVAASEAGKDPLDPAILADADKAIKASLAAMGVAAPAAGEKTPAADGKATKVIIPPTLGALPAADIIETDSKYGALDRLEGTAFEDAFAKLPEAERAAYLERQ